MTDKNNYYIIMADIINSREKDSADLMIKFKQLVDEINERNHQKILSPLTITLGDEFQGVMKTLYDSILIMIDLEETIIRQGFEFKLRYVLNYGEIETPINTEIAYEMLGKGLTDARSNLNKMKGNRKNRFNISIFNRMNLEQKLNYAFINLQKFFDDWKVRDFGIISAFIKGLDYKLVAKQFDKDNSLMWRRRESLDINEYLALKALILLITKTD